MINEKELYTTKEVAKFLKVTSVYITKICRSGELKAKMIGSKDSKRITWRILGEDLQNYINNK